MNLETNFSMSRTLPERSGEEKQISAANPVKSNLHGTYGQRQQGLVMFYHAMGIFLKKGEGAI